MCYYSSILCITLHIIAASQFVVGRKSEKVDNVSQTRVEKQAQDITYQEFNREATPVGKHLNHIFGVPVKILV